MLLHIHSIYIIKYGNLKQNLLIACVKRKVLWEKFVKEGDLCRSKGRHIAIEGDWSKKRESPTKWRMVGNYVMFKSISTCTCVLSVYIYITNMIFKMHLSKPELLFKFNLRLIVWYYVYMYRVFQNICPIVTKLF